MSAAKHTPGPWFNTTEDDKVTGSVGTNEFKNDIALCWSDSAKADAQLIAKLPDLLADLRQAAETLRNYEAQHLAKGTPESTVKAGVNAALASRFEATIALATGRAI